MPSREGWNHKHSSSPTSACFGVVCACLVPYISPFSWGATTPASGPSQECERDEVCCKPSPIKRNATWERQPVEHSRTLRGNGYGRQLSYWPACPPRRRLVAQGSRPLCRGKRTLCTGQLDEHPRQSGAGDIGKTLKSRNTRTNRRFAPDSRPT
jgi:hypothetical protein